MSLTLEQTAEIIGIKKANLEKIMNGPEKDRPVNLYYLDEEKQLFCQYGVEQYVKHSEERQGQAQIVDDDQLAVIFHEAQKSRFGIRNQALLALSNYSGLRCVEISRLLMGDVWKNGQIPKYSTLMKSRTKNKETRTMFFDNDKLRKYLQPHINQRLEEGAQPEDPLFIGERTRSAYTRHRLAAIFKAIYAQCGHPECSSHSGRARVATTISKKAGLKAAQMILGHKNPATTMRYERHTDDELSAFQRDLG